jgi:hypothetical protein
MQATAVLVLLAWFAIYGGLAWSVLIWADSAASRAVRERGVAGIAPILALIAGGVSA